MGQINFDIVQKYVDEVVTVEENEIANAVLLLLEMEKIVAEGAGAVPLAALLNRKVPLEGRKVLLIISGGNIDVNILGKIITRGLAMEGRIAQLIVRLKDLPGSLTAALEIMKGLQANILEIAHHRFDSLAPFGQVDVSITLETKGHAHIHQIQEALQKAGYLCENQCRFGVECGMGNADCGIKTNRKADRKTKIHDPHRLLFLPQVGATGRSP